MPDVCCLLSAVHHLDSTLLHPGGGHSPYRNSVACPEECKHSLSNRYYSCTAHFSTKIVPTDIKKARKRPFYKLLRAFDVLADFIFADLQKIIFAQLPVNSDKNPPKIFLFFLSFPSFFLSVSMFKPPAKNSLFSSLFPIPFLKNAKKQRFQRIKNQKKQQKISTKIPCQQICFSSSFSSPSFF